MRLYVGHYEGRPREWFLAWALSRAVAQRVASETTQDRWPEERSIRLVNEPGHVEFLPRAVDNDALLSAPKLHAPTRLAFGAQGTMRGSVDTHVQRTLRDAGILPRPEPWRRSS